ncbi:MAG: M1 family metallopeptidase [Paraglaciecola sp.]|nr:M1 family metallopeptidase [Paraglaciecola sp.]
MALKSASVWLLGVMLSSSLLINKSAATEQEHYRISDDVTPTFQQITLRIDPDQPTFNGETTFDITVNKSTDTVEFYQIGLTISVAELIDGEQRIPLTVTARGYDIQQAKAAKKLATKPYQLHLVFSGKVNTSSDGMYLSKFEGNNYIFTQFEDMHARRAFPSFDEPAFKIPYQVTISAPEKHTVISNTLVNKRSVADGWQTVEFNKTKPMPSYILAYAVGEMDSADIEGLSIPGKIYTPKGQAHRTKFVASHTAPLLKGLENYFGSPYPFEKIDFVAVPNFTHGAMENAGLVTYRSSYLLLEDEPNLTEQRGPLNVVTHELAHMWYGNLVTMAWWDDLWLNEAFASWMATKVMLSVHPEQNLEAGLVQEGAFGADASPTTKPVKKIVKSQVDVMDGLGLNYSKGESILQMIEALVGEKAFQKGIQTYMKNNAWGNAEADDLWAVLSTVADFDVPALMKTYLEQPAYPLVEFNQSGGISQSRYRLQGAEVKEQTWIVPLAISYKKNGKIQRQQLFLKEQNMQLPELAEAEWIYPNDNAMGYMRWQIPSAQLQALIKDISALNAREKKSLLYNTDALFKAGKIDLAEHMSVLDALAGDEDPVVGSAVVAALNDLVFLVDADNEAKFAKFAQSKLLTWFKRLGTTELASDSSDVSRLRSGVFGLLARYTNSPEVSATSLQLTQAFLADPNSVPRSIAAPAMRNVVRLGDATWFDKFKNAYQQTNDANVQGVIGRAMIFPQAENVQKVLDFAMTDNVTPANVIGFIARAASGQDDKTELYKWLETHFAALVKKMPEYHVARLPEYASSSCNAKDIEMSAAFYQTRKVEHAGMERSVDIEQEESKQCLTLKMANQQSFNAYLEKVNAGA